MEHTTIQVRPNRFHIEGNNLEVIEGPRDYLFKTLGVQCVDFQTLCIIPGLLSHTCTYMFLYRVTFNVTK